MAFYRWTGPVSPRRHTQFPKPADRLCTVELVGEYAWIGAWR